MVQIDWTERLRADPEPVLRRMPVALIGLKKGDLRLQPPARIVDAAIRAIPKGETVNLLELRAKLARQHKADGCCPVYLGYCLRTVAEPACEARDRGVQTGRVTPIWRVLDETAPTLKKLAPPDADWVRKQRARVARRGG